MRRATVSCVHAAAVENVTLWPTEDLNTLHCLRAKGVLTLGKFYSANGGGLALKGLKRMRC